MRALAIVHQADAGPGVFAEEMRARGAEVETWSITEEPDPPGGPADWDAVMVFGGAMHPDQEDSHPWLVAEKRLLAALVERGTPLLGACLGAELVCEAAGGSVRRLPEPEIGWFAVEVLSPGEDDPLVGPLAPTFTGFQWHRYEYVPPPDAEVLARSAACVQAFRAGARAWGIQFHAEVTATDAGKWIDEWRSDEDAVSSGLDVDALRAETAKAIGPWNELGRALCGRFLSTAAKTAGA